MKSFYKLSSPSPMKKILVLYVMFIMNSISANYAQNVGEMLHGYHEVFKEQSITKRRFGHQTLVANIERLKINPLFEVSKATLSSEGRDIYLIKCGTGKTKVLLWSQMHGDEATATMALMDIFNFLENRTNSTVDDQQLNQLRTDLLKECTFYFVPMLNPDGAEAWSRYTALGIDMNRDALALQTPEGALLKKLVFDLKPDFAFNLHDKGRRYSAGKTGNLATISFLATAYNEAQEVNETRKKAMLVIVGMNHALQPFIPNAVGKWPSDFEPRAFGDNIQKWGSTLILIESGGFKNDPEKQYIRQLNFVAILTGLKMIADKSYEKEDISEYEAIPVNDRVIYDLIIRNVTIKKGNTTYQADIAINRNERPVKGRDYFTQSSVIEEIGDMSVFFGTDEIDATGLTFSATQEISLGQKAEFELVKDGKVIYKINNGVKL